MIHDEKLELVKAITRLETKVDQLIILENRVRLLEDKENQRKGGWLVLTGLLTVAGTIGGVIASFFHSTLK